MKPETGSKTPETSRQALKLETGSKTPETSRQALKPETTPKVKRFEDLSIFQKARELSKKIYPLTERGKFQYDSRFVQQLRAAAGSIMDNIAEGFERTGNKEFVNFLYIAKGSCGEVRSQLIRAHDVGYLTDSEFEELYSECRKLSASIMNFVKEIKSSEFVGSKYKS